MPSKTLFTVPVPSTDGSFTCSTVADRIYLLAFASPPDNRLTSAFIDAFLLSLDIIEEKYPKGVVITTSSIPKFYSNGLDIEHVLDTPNFFAEKMNKLCDRLLTFSSPTIALLNGHAFAGGCFVSFHHDYRIQNPSRGFLCLNEIDIGMAIPTALLSIMREKVTSASVFRAMVLEGKRFNSNEAYSAGLVDALGGLEEAVKFAEERKLVEKAESGPWGMMKEDMYRETLGYLRDAQGTDEWRAKIEEAKEGAEKERTERVEEWEKNNVVAKL